MNNAEICHLFNHNVFTANIIIDDYVFPNFSLNDENLLTIDLLDEEFIAE